VRWLLNSVLIPSHYFDCPRIVLSIEILITILIFLVLSWSFESSTFVFRNTR